VFEKSIRALQKLNELGYAGDENLKLNLVYNPLGAQLPGAQSELEAAYKKSLRENFGIEFNNLFCLANMPIARFANHLRLSGLLCEYSQLLLDNFNPHSVEGLMCRETISVGWRGEIYDCDFNQMLKMQWRDEEPLFLWDIEPSEVVARPIQTASHCFGCTAGAGSSCGGATVRA
jgi:radical SAM/Cys-rich protein